MTSQYRHRRTSNPATAFPNPLEPGEIAVNTANRQIAIGDAQSGVIGAPLPAIAVRYFDIRGKYVANDFVQNGTSIFRANKATGPGAFVVADWEMMVGQFDPQYVAKAGDTMTGMLFLPATVPSVGTHATNKTYVDTGLAAKSTIYSATSPPAGVADNSMWFETDTGLLYVKYNDGSTSQWVIACPQPDISNFVLRSGDNMSGPLGVPLTPTLPAHATSKSYVDAQLAGKSSIIASDTPPVGAIDNSLWYETDSGATYVRYNDLNGGAQWVAIADPAGLVYAAPFDAMAYSGMQINGSFEVSQENGNNPLTLSGYVCDGWKFFNNTTAAVNAIRAAGSIVPGITNTLVTTVGTGLASLSAAHIISFDQNIEGYRFARLAWGTASARPVTIGFWVQHNRAGIYSVAVRNNGGTRSYVTSYTQDVVNAIEYKTVTIPGDTSGTWLADNGVGVILSFCMGSGTQFTAPATNVWAAGNYVAASGQVNAVAATSDNFRITGVVVLPGIEAPRADRSALIMRPYDQELRTCERYYQLLSVPILGLNWPGGAAGFGLYHFVPYRTEMRAVPSLAWKTTTAGSNCNATVSQQTQWATRMDVTAVAAGAFFIAGSIIAADARP